MPLALGGQVAGQGLQDSDLVLAARLLRLEGAYTLLITVGRVLYAVVDPRGFRPLMLGKVGDAPVVASESCALDIVGAQFTCEVEPGTVVPTGS